MTDSHRSSLPAWVWNLAEAAQQCSLQYDETQVPEHVWQAFEASLQENGSAAEHRKIVLDFLKTCKPLQAHHFLHCINQCRDFTAEWDVVLHRPDCDQATALAYVAYSWGYYEEGRSEWIEDDVHELMSYIRTRAWNGGFKVHGFDVTEWTLHELDDMRETFANREGHPYSLPASFLAISRKEALFHKLREKFLPRRPSIN